MPPTKDFSWRYYSIHVYLSAGGNLVSQSFDFLSRQAGHYCDTGDICRTASESVIGSCYVNKSALGDFGEFPVADAGLH